MDFKNSRLRPPFTKNIIVPSTTNPCNPGLYILYILYIIYRMYIPSSHLLVHKTNKARVRAKGILSTSRERTATKERKGMDSEGNSEMDACPNVTSGQV